MNQGARELGLLVPSPDPDDIGAIVAPPCFALMPVLLLYPPFPTPQIGKLTSGMDLRTLGNNLHSLKFDAFEICTK